jgi:hypothetical protein
MRRLFDHHAARLPVPPDVSREEEFVTAEMIVDGAMPMGVTS